MGTFFSRPKPVQTQTLPVPPAMRSPKKRSASTPLSHPPKRPRSSPVQSSPPRGQEREEDIRGPAATDAPVLSEYKLRAIRKENGLLTLDTRGDPLYSPNFFETCATTNSVLPTDPSAVKRSARIADANCSQVNFLDFGLRKRLRKRQVAFERSASVLPMWDDERFLAGDVIGAPQREARKIDMRGMLYLAPLTTVGNLPFRRVCKRLGADVTCGEMALASNLLQGQNSEWALLRRHSSEDLFGIQLAGSKVETITRAAELVARECQIDFVELNAGCPIDIVFNKGGGCSLMKRRQKMRRLVWSVSRVVDVPVGVKVRTGVAENCRNAHEIIPDVCKAGAGWITVHGRSRKQRYSKLADWGYIIDQCAPAAQQAGIPLLGNGDVYNWRDAGRFFADGEFGGVGVNSVMVARGALIKPWIFTEIKERRDWDIRSTERLELYKEFARNGLEHWGSDARGVENTRRFLLEWLSFLYRYVPLGLIEGGADTVVTMSHRAPFFRGRDELETLLGSPIARDWVRITEMILGKVPDGFRFEPKHKSNAWEGAEDYSKG